MFSPLQHRILKAGGLTASNFGKREPLDALPRSGPVAVLRALLCQAE